MAAKASKIYALLRLGLYSLQFTRNSLSPNSRNSRPTLASSDSVATTIERFVPPCDLAWSPMSTNTAMEVEAGKSPVIRPINKGVVHRICAGQVILDLSSAVKELVENSIDAGATSVEIALKEYGLESFQVIDNGSGISPQNFKVILFYTRFCFNWKTWSGYFDIVWRRVIVLLFYFTRLMLPR